MVKTIFISLVLVLVILLPTQCGKVTKPTPTPKVPDEKKLKEHEEDVKKIQKESKGHPKDEVGKKMKDWHPGNKGNPEEQGTYLQGDILWPLTSETRQGIANVTYRWPKGIVYYSIAPAFTTVERLVISSAISLYHSNTCIRFVPYSGLERDFVVIERNNTGCWSTLGRVGGRQVVNLQSPGCLFYIGTIIHEFMHTVGFIHEHSRIDRDSAINVIWGSIIKGQEFNFKIYNSSLDGFYDYGSVMHYSKYAFSKDMSATIVPLVNGAQIGQRQRFSLNDIARIRNMYICSGGISLL